MKMNWKASGNRHDTEPEANDSPKVTQLPVVWSANPRKDTPQERSSYTEHEPENVHYHLDNNQLSAPAGLGGLALPDRRCGRVDAVADARDHPSHEHLGQTEGRSLQNGPNGHDGCSDENGLFTPEPFANPDSRYGTEEAADVVDSSYRALHRIVTHNAHLVEKVVGHDDAAEDALVISGA